MRLTNTLLAVVAVLLLANLVVALNPPIVARAKSLDAMDRVADALNRIADNGVKVRTDDQIKVEVRGEYSGYQPVVVKQVK